MKGLRLKPVRKSDLGLIYELMNEEAVRGNSFNGKKFSEGEHLRYWNAKMQDKDFKAYAIWLNDNFVGLVRLESMEVSVAVKQEYCGKGVAFSALNKLSLGGFRARVKPGNAASLALFKKLGFEEKQGSKPVKYINSG